MLSVIVESEGEGERLPGLLALLTSAAVEGLAREVILAGGRPPELLAALREETGAGLSPDLATAIKEARADLLLIMAAEFRPKPHWLEALSLHLKGGGREAVLTGQRGGFLKRAPAAVLIGRASAATLAHPDLDGLRRRLGRGAPSIG